jgi:glucosamine-6-phosphate deaminase
MTTSTAPLPIQACSPADAAREVAGEIAALIRERRAAGRMAVLCLPTGRTPLGVYDELVRMQRDEGLDFANVTTFNLDEFLGLPPEHPQSFRRYMRERFFARIGLEPTHTWIPSGDVAPAQIAAHCAEYEREIADAGGLDYALLGIGRNGHIGFNEPGSVRDSRTREVRLHEVTRADAARAFGGLEFVPERAITMGVATILGARRVRVLAFGADKREILRRTLEDAPGPQVPATFLRGHSDVRLLADGAALGR